jgi:hypothetical protein
MFKRIMPLNADKQSDMRITAQHNWQFAASELLVPLAFSEMADAAREYPLVFLKEKGLFYALLGFERGVNAYLGDDGRWRARYIPARLRSYPFALAAAKDQPGKFVIVADADSSLLNTQTGEPLFVNGAPGPALKAKMTLLESMQKSEPATQNMVNAIREADLLVDRAIQVKKPDAEHPALGGFQVVDEQKLNGLSDAKFNKLRKAGALPLVYAHLLSMANLRQGVIAGKYPELDTASDRKVMRAPSMDDLLGGLLN